MQSLAGSVQISATEIQSTAGNIADLAAQIGQNETDEEVVVLASQMTDLARQIEQDGTQLGITADEINYRIDNSEETTLALSDDIGVMADSIGSMSDRILWTELQIGDMANRIVESGYLISDSTLALVDEIQTSLDSLTGSTTDANQSADEIGAFSLKMGTSGASANADEVTVFVQAAEYANSACCCSKATLLSIQLLQQQSLRMQSTENDADVLASLEEMLTLLDEAERNATQEVMVLEDLKLSLNAKNVDGDAADLLARASEFNERILWAQGELDGIMQTLSANPALVDEYALLPEMQKALATGQEMAACVEMALQAIAAGMFN